MALLSSRPTSSQRALARIGMVIQECRIERLVGIGGMAAVYAATHADGRRMAIKFLLERFNDDPNMLRLFRREANVANQVGHPGVVPVLECNVDEEGCAFLMMPLLEGETVRTRWERAKLHLPIADVGVLASDTLDVLASAHVRGIVHRDIKPENLFVASDGYVRVLDFGIARRIDGDGSATLTGQMIGTPAFMPPEQALGNRDAIGPASDCWAVGATIFSLLSGEFVHAAESVSGQLAAAATRHARSLGDVAPNLPVSIVRFVDKALAFEPSDRWSAAREMREALHATWEGVMGEPIASAATRIRAAYVADLSQVSETTRVTRAPSVDELPHAVPARIPHQFVHPDIEVTAVLPRLLGTMTPMVNRVLADHGLGRFSDTGWFIPDTRSWWPMEVYVAAFHALVSAVGPIKALDMGRQVEKYVALPPEPMMHNIHSTLLALDVAYHLNHRKGDEVMFDIESGRMIEGIGHYHYRGRGAVDHSIMMECENPYPCDMDLGIILGFARRFEPHAIVEHARGACRNAGADSCIYQVTWW